MSELIPDDILQEILASLPLEPLLRFRCVCKSWKRLIDSHQFFKDHLHHSQKTNSNLKIIFKNHDLYSAGFDLLTQTNCSTFEEISYPLKTPDRDMKILCSCDGLLLCSEEVLQYQFNSIINSQKIVLWNPFIRRFHRIPVNGIEYKGYSTIRCLVYGFGYDSVNNDYKLVKIVQFNGKNNEINISKVMIYSLKSDSWRRIQDFPKFLHPKKSNGAFTNGALHWSVNRKSVDQPLVVAFDLGIEVYRLVPLPEFTGFNFCMDVKVLGGCLTLVWNNHNNFDIWVMKEYGVRESWSILFTFKDIYFGFSFNVLTPIVYSDCGKKMLLRVDNWFKWYDIHKNQAFIPVFQIPYPYLGNFELHFCSKSLLLLNKFGTDE